MRNMVAMLDQAKHMEREEVSSPKIEMIRRYKGGSRIKIPSQMAETSADRV